MTVPNSDSEKIIMSWNIQVSTVVVQARLIEERFENSVVWAEDHRRTDGVGSFTCSHAISES